MEIIIIILLIVLNGIFSMSEMALVSARRSSLASEAKKGNKAARRALALSEQPDKFLSTVQIGITLIGILTGLYSGAKLAGDFGAVLEKTGVPAEYSARVAQITIIVIVTYLTLIVGELIPKRIGLSAAEKVSKAVAGPMRVLSAIGTPFVWILSKSTEGMIKLLGIKGEVSKVTEDEIRNIIQEGTEDGEVQEVEQDIMERVLSLGDRKVESIMTHRTDIVWLDISWNRARIDGIVGNDPHSIYPVADGTLDKIVGVVSMKDLFRRIDKDVFKLEQLIQPVHYIHENTAVYTALDTMRGRQFQYSIIIDEFGSTQGIITYKDILEALVGLIPEAGEEPDIIRRDDGSWLVDGQCPFYDFLTCFDEEELYPDNEYNTLSGLLLELMGHIPRSGEKVSWKIFSFEIMDMDGARIDKVLVTKHGAADEDR